MKFRMLGASAIAALLVTIAAPAPAAFAQNGQAQPVLTKQMVKPYNEAIMAIQAKDYATAQTKINEATAQAKTPVDKGQIERLKLQVALDTKNAPQQIASVNALLASGTLSADEVRQYKKALPGMYTAAGDEANAMTALRASVDQYGGTADDLILIADKASKSNDPATAATYAEKAIAASPSAPETWYRLYMRSLQAAGQNDKYYAELEKFVLKYPKEEYWRILIGRAQKESRFSNDLYLDLYRAVAASGSSLTEQERSKAADEALRRGYPGEALELLDMANAMGKLNSELDKKNLGIAKAQSANDKASLAKDTKDALAKGSATELAATAEAQLSYGDNAKAAELFQAAIAKGISDPAALAAAKLRLGIAQYRNGDKAAAKATWADVKSDDGAGMLARNWILIADAPA